MWRHHNGSLTATAMGDGDTTPSASLQKAEISGKPHWPFRTKGTQPSLLQHPPEQLKPLMKKIIICFYWKTEIWSNCLPSLIFLRIKICFPCYVLLLFWTENSFPLLFAICMLSFAHSDEHVASACPCVPLPWLGCSCQFPLCFCAERRRDDTVHPDESEPTVLRRDPWASTWSRLPAVPHGTANPAAELCHRLYRPAAPYSRVLRLWTSHFPASPPAPSLSTGICSTASTCSGEWALSSHLWSIAYSSSILTSTFPPRIITWSTWVALSGPYRYCPPTKPDRTYSAIVQSRGGSERTRNATDPASRDTVGDGPVFQAPGMGAARESTPSLTGAPRQGK